MCAADDIEHGPSLVPSFFLFASHQSNRSYWSLPSLCKRCCLLQTFTQTEKMHSLYIISKDVQSLKYLPRQACISTLLLCCLAWSFHYWNNLWLDSESQAAISGRFCWEEALYCVYLGDLVSFVLALFPVWNYGCHLGFEYTGKEQGNHHDFVPFCGLGSG